MVGIPGSGKTFFAEKFADTFKAPYISQEKITPYTSGDKEAATAVMHAQLEELFKTQQSVILEGSTDTRTERGALTNKARTNGYEPLLIWVQTDSATAKSRVVKEGKGKTAHTLTSEEYEHIIKRFTPPHAVEKPVVVSGKHTYATQAKVILKKLSAPRAQISTHTSAPVRENSPTRRNITIR